MDVVLISRNPEKLQDVANEIGNIQSLKVTDFAAIYSLVLHVCRIFVLNSLLHPFVESKSRVKTKCVAIDFTEGPPIYAKVKSALTGLDIGVLGMTSYILKEF